MNFFENEDLTVNFSELELQKSSLSEIQTLRKKLLNYENNIIEENQNLLKENLQLKEEIIQLENYIINSKNSWADENNFLRDELKIAENNALQIKLKYTKVLANKDYYHLKYRELRNVIKQNSSNSNKGLLGYFFK